MKSYRKKTWPNDLIYITTMIRSYLSHIINDHKTQGEWKTQLTIGINFISSKDSNETHTMHTKSDNIEIVMVIETDDIIEELFESLFQRYQEELEESLQGSEFFFIYCIINFIK